MGFHNILVPIDFSECSLRALEIAKRMADADPERVTVTVFHVGDIQRALGHHWSEEMLPVGPAVQDATEEERERLRQSVVRVTDERMPRSSRPAVLVRMGHPAEEICDQIEAGDHDLIVMGTRGRTGLERFLLGSVAERIVQRSAVPVLVVH